MNVDDIRDLLCMCHSRFPVKPPANHMLMFHSSGLMLRLFIGAKVLDVLLEHADLTKSRMELTQDIEQIVLQSGLVNEAFQPTYPSAT